jgi:hypothetical protein
MQTAFNLPWFEIQIVLKTSIKSRIAEIKRQKRISYHSKTMILHFLTEKMKEQLVISNRKSKSIKRKSLKSVLHYISNKGTCRANWSCIILAEKQIRDCGFVPIALEKTRKRRLNFRIKKIDLPLKIEN